MVVDQENAHVRLSLMQALDAALAVFGITEAQQHARAFAGLAFYLEIPAQAARPLLHDGEAHVLAGMSFRRAPSQADTVILHQHLVLAFRIIAQQQPYPVSPAVLADVG